MTVRYSKVYNRGMPQPQHRMLGVKHCLRLRYFLGHSSTLMCLYHIAAASLYKYRQCCALPHWMQQPLPGPVKWSSLRRRRLDDIRVTCMQHKHFSTALNNTRASAYKMRCTALQARQMCHVSKCPLACPLSSTGCCSIGEWPLTRVCDCKHRYPVQLSARCPQLHIVCAAKTAGVAVLAHVASTAAQHSCSAYTTVQANILGTSVVQKRPRMLAIWTPLFGPQLQHANPCRGPVVHVFQGLVQIYTSAGQNLLHIFAQREKGPHFLCSGARPSLKASRSTLSLTS